MSDSPTSAPNRIINLDSEYKIKIEKGNEFNNSIFADVYRQARQNVADILSHSNDDNKHDSYNNIIAFTGERGKGKSSTMISFLNSLVNKNIDDHSGFYIKKNEIDFDFSKFNFLTIDVIDPSLFRREEQLFEIIIAKLFSQFRKEVEDKNGKNVNDEDRRELVKLFQQVFENLKYINNRADIYKQDALDALIKLSTSSNLKENFDKLIAKYLAVFGKKDITNFLVIAIDDFDLKIDGVYEMMEDIRQYFITKSIIILMACKMEQLNDCIYLAVKKKKFAELESSMLEEFKGITTEEKIMTTKYVEKFIPIQRQLIIPSIEDISLHSTNVSNSNKETSSSYLDPKSEDLDILIIREVFLTFEIFVSIDQYNNNVLFPNTMRNYNTLIAILKSNNKNLFKNYIANLLKEQDTDLYNFYLNSKTKGRSSIISLYILLIERFFNRIKPNRTNLEHESNEGNLIESIFQFKDVSNYVPSIIFNLFLLIDDYIDKRNINEYQTFELIKILYELDFSKAKFNEDESYKDSYYVNPELLPSKFRLSKNTSLDKNRDIFQIKIDDVNRELFSSPLSQTTSLPIDLNSLEKNVIDEGVQNNTELKEKFFKSSIHISNEINIVNQKDIEFFNLYECIDEKFTQFNLDVRDYLLLFLEYFGKSKYLSKGWSISSFHPRHLSFNFNIFGLLFSLTKINEKQKIVARSLNILFDSYGNDHFLKLLENTAFVTELYKELVLNIDSYFQSSNRPFLDTNKSEDYFEYIKHLYLFSLPSVINKINKKYKLGSDKIKIKGIQNYFNELLSIDQPELIRFKSIVNDGFNKVEENSSLVINKLEGLISRGLELTDKTKNYNLETVKRFLNEFNIKSDNFYSQQIEELKRIPQTRLLKEETRKLLNKIKNG